MAIKDLSYYSRSHYSTDSNWNPTTKGNFTTIRKVNRTMAGGYMPNWREVIKNGGNATTVLTGTYEIFENRAGSHTVTRKNIPTVQNPGTSFWVDWNGYLAGSVIPAVIEGGAAAQAEANTKAKLSFNKQLRKTSTIMQGSVFLGEMRKAIAMLRRPAQSLFKGFGEYLSTVSKRNRGQRKKPKQLSKIAAETWLEYSFGWIPLLHDVQDGYKAYKSLSRKQETIRVGAGGEAERLLAKQVDPTLTLNGYCVYSKETYWTQKVHVRYYGAIKLQAGMDTSTVMERFGLNLGQFIPTAWELLPWSFLADYFTNIGDILSYDHSLNSRLTWYASGMLDENVVKCFVKPNHAQVKINLGANFLDSFGSVSTASIRRRSIIRSIPSLSLLDVNLTSLQFSVPTGFGKAANMVALLLARTNGIHPQNFRS